MGAAGCDHDGPLGVFLAADIGEIDVVVVEFLEQIGLDRAARSPERTKIEVPLDIVMSLLRPEELEKLKNYITSYLMKRDSSEVLE